MKKNRIIQDLNKRCSPINETRIAFSGFNATDCFECLAKLSDQKFLFESKDISHVYGRMSLMGIDPIVKIVGKDDSFSVELVSDRGAYIFNVLKEIDFSFCDSVVVDIESISGTVKTEKISTNEYDRSKSKNISLIVRSIQNFLVFDVKAHLGLYGAFSYDFVRLFEAIDDSLPISDVNDFTLYLYDTFVFFDHLKGRSEVITYRSSESNDAEHYLDLINNANLSKTEYKVFNPEFLLENKDYQYLVDIAQDQSSKGEIFEVVFSNILNANFEGDPYALYKHYSVINPSPYMFFYDFGEEQLIGASPEMMIRVEDRKVHMRPISGTAERGLNAIDDQANMMTLLNSVKEKSELDMLIDLGRNDLSRVCKPGIHVAEYRHVEKYSKVMHTIAHLTGDLKDDCTAFDALIASLNAGTLTGAPKVAAMKLIEKHEKKRRGYYGGTIGYLNFSGDMDTGIIIRTAHIKNGVLNFQVGATLLYDSDPESEYQETISKAQAFLTTISQ
jgi:anthranilate synthase